MALAAPGRPKRLFVFYMPHGSPGEHMDPMGTGTNFSLTGNGVGVFGPLEPYKRYTTILRGMELKGRSNHGAIIGTMTDGAERSIDQEVARAIGTTPLVLGAIPHRRGGLDADSHLIKDGDWIRPESNPVRAYDRTFESLGTGPSPTPGPTPNPSTDPNVFRAQALGLTQSELDAFRRDVRGLTREEDKLSRHLAAVQRLKEDAEGRIRTGDDDDPPPTGAACSTAPALSSVSAHRGQSDDFFLRDENFGAIAEAQADIGAHALLCGVTRVVALQCMYVNAPIPFPHIGISEGHHDPCSHSRDVAGREKFARCQQWIVGLMARAAQILDVPDPEDPDHTALENSLLYISSEIADGNEHMSRKAELYIAGAPVTGWVPMAMVGNAGGAIRGGQVLEFENRAHGDALLTIAQAMGHSISSFGQNGRAPIAEAMS